MVHKQLEQPITLKEKKIIEKIDNAAQIIINEIELQNENKGTISNMFQLEKILNELNQMKLSLSKKFFLPTFSRMIIDSWDYSTPLGNILLEIYEEYMNL